MADPSLPSRYHSQRRNQAPPDDAPPLPDDSVARSKSRYRRKPDSGPGSPPREPVPRIPDQQLDASPYKTGQPPLHTVYKEQVLQAPQQRRDSSAGGRPAGHGAQDPRSLAGDGNTRHASDDHVDLMNLPPSPPPIGELFPPTKPAEPLRPGDRPPDSSAIRATRSMSSLQQYETSSGCFGGLFRRKEKESDRPNSPKLPIARPATAKKDPQSSRGGGAANLGIDAPVSGDRHVLVECGRSQSLFPVSQDTTAADLIRRAATCMSERIDEKSAVLLENFTSAGVQRPLRRYEHVRDVMNSWNTDSQNSLLLIEPGTGTIESELTVLGAPKEAPEEQTWQLFWSQKAGKWDRRYVTLRSTGQLICHKDLDKTKDIVHVCHLNDFDIYAPTQDRLKKKIKPPKKFCYAVKSQQKTSLFESIHDFVHFFSVGDRKEAESFHNAVQNWRSWWLVNVKGEGKRAEAPKAVQASNSKEAQQRANSSGQADGHHAKASTDAQYQLGSFRPMTMNFDSYEPTPDSSESERPGSSRGFAKAANQFDVNVSPERRASNARKAQHPPLSLKSKPVLADDEPLANINRQASVKRRSSTDQRRPDASEFNDAGLLGRKYSQRQKEQTAREAQRQEPFTLGPNLLNGGRAESSQYDSGEGLRRNTSVRASKTSHGDTGRSESVRGNGSSSSRQRGSSVDLQRSGSKRQPLKPLIDLTPQYQEPPQHAKKGKGFRPQNIGAGGLIDSATSPEDPLGIPSQTVFKKTSREYGGPTSPGMVEESRNMDAGSASRNRGRSVSGQQQSSSRQVSGSSRPAEAFTGGGLLASAENRQGWGGSTKGRGVVDGTRANGRPLVDLNQDSRFVPGSLLNQVEQSQGGPVPMPVIDREYREEKTLKYGEGVFS